MHAYLPAIDVLMCHCGISFEEACEQLGVSMVYPLQWCVNRLQECSRCLVGYQ